MARVLVLCLILTNAFVVLSVAHNNAASSANPSASSGLAEVAAARRLGNHHHGVVSLAAPPSLSPLAAPKAEENEHTSTEGSSYSSLESESCQAQDMEVVHHHHHHSIDESSAGGGVILGGLATTFLVAIICYIRATRRKNAVASANSAETTAQV